MHMATTEVDCGHPGQRGGRDSGGESWRFDGTPGVARTAATSLGLTQPASHSFGWAAEDVLRGRVRTLEGFAGAHAVPPRGVTAASVSNALSYLSRGTARLLVFTRR